MWHRQIIGGCVAVAALAIACGGGSKPAAITDHTIVFVWPCGGGVYIAEAGASEVRQLHEGTVSGGADLSPDGRRVAFTAGGVHVVDIDSGKKVQLAKGPGIADAFWSPDGQKIAFHRFNDGAAGMGSAIFTVRADSTDERMIAEGMFVGWSKDSSEIAYTIWRATGAPGGAVTVMATAIDGSGGQRALADDLTGATFGFGVTPNFDRVVFKLLGNTGSDFTGGLGIFVVDTTHPGEPRELLRGDENLNLAAGFAPEAMPSPDGKWIAFVDRGEYVRDEYQRVPAIWVIGIDGANKRKLSSDRSVPIDEEVMWTPDSKEVWFRREEKNLYAAPVDGSGERLVPFSAPICRSG